MTALGPKTLAVTTSGAVVKVVTPWKLSPSPSGEDSLSGRDSLGVRAPHPALSPKGRVEQLPLRARFSPEGRG